MLSLVKHKNTQGERLHVKKVSWFEVCIMAHNWCVRCGVRNGNTITHL